MLKYKIILSVNHLTKRNFARREENMDTQNNFPYHFDSNACKKCGGKCCRGKQGYIWISVEELEKIAAAIKIDVSQFLKQYVRQVQGRLSLQERVINGEHFCCFFNPIDALCTIYQNRPEQCRSYPFWDKSGKDAQKLLDECPGVSSKKDWKLVEPFNIK